MMNLLKTGLVFQCPVTKQLVSRNEYLSGNIAKKIQQAKSAGLTDNVTALESIMPEVNANVIVKIGSTLVTAAEYQTFICNLLDSYNGVTVAQCNVTNRYEVAGTVYVEKSYESTQVYGTKGMNAVEIFSRLLNKGRFVIYKKNLDGQNEIDQDETVLLMEKVGAMHQAFEDFVAKKNITERYHDKYGAIVPRVYDGSQITLHGSNQHIKLRPHQLDAIARIVQSPTSLIAHVVGAGKTWALVGGIMELKRLKKVNKPCFVVPNHLVGQIAKEFIELYPNAVVLTCPTDAASKKSFLSKLKDTEFDCVILGFEQFRSLGIDPERKIKSLKNQIARYRDYLYSLQTSYTVRKGIMRDVKKRLKVVESRLAELHDKKSDHEVSVTFEETGIDALFVDEAHKYKNKYIFTKHSNIPGIGSGVQNQTTEDIQMKIEYIRETYPAKKVVFATGTPIANSMSELYTMQTYLQWDLLLDLNLQHFDNWASDFGNVVGAIELSPDGKNFRHKERFSEYINVEGMLNLFRQIADVKMNDDLKLPLPKVNRHNVTVEPTEKQKLLVNLLSEAADLVQKKKLDKSEMNFLTITTTGRKLALDTRLANVQGVVETLEPWVKLTEYEKVLLLSEKDNGDKIKVLCDNVSQIYHETAAEKLTQMIFIDQGTPKTQAQIENAMKQKGQRPHDTYADIKAKLIARGVKLGEIAYIHEANTTVKKGKLFEAVRAGEIRVLIGSTEKMGTGTNVQAKLIALHNVDCPWRPCDIEQRNGRIIRQGNENAEVSIYNYVTKGTFDAYSWQTIERKAKFISQIMTNKVKVDRMEEIDEQVLSYGEIKAIATGNPLIKRKLELDIEVSRLGSLVRQQTKNLLEIEKKRDIILPNKLERLKKDISALTLDIPKVDTLKYETVTRKVKQEDGTTVEKEFTKEVFVASLLNSKGSFDKLEDRTLTNKELFTLHETHPTGTKIGEYRGFDIIRHTSTTDGYASGKTIIIRAHGSYILELGSIGQTQKIDDKLDSLRNLLSHNTLDLENAEIELSKLQTFQDNTDYQLMLNNTQQELNKINNELGLNDNQQNVA